MLSDVTSRMNPLPFLILPGLLAAQVPPDCSETATATIQVEASHPWRPPFGLDRIGKPIEITAHLTLEGRPFREYTLVGYRAGQEVERHILHLTRSQAPYVGRAT